jgi:hypothetical protein
MNAITKTDEKTASRRRYLGRQAAEKRKAQAGFARR